jgi:hypothetical protein
MLRWYGDFRAAEEQWPNLLLYMEYLDKLPTVNTTGLLTYNVYNDWDRPSGKPGDTTASTTASATASTTASTSSTTADKATDTPIVPDPTKGPRGIPSPLISSYVYVRQLRMMTAIGASLGHSADAAAFEAKAKNAASIFIQAYLRNGSFADGGPLPSQSAQALGLKLFDPATDAVLAPLLSDAARRGMQKALLDQVMEKEVHSFAGIIGQKQLFPMCSVVPASVNAGTLSGRALSLIMNTQTTYPSFGYELAHGATTLWSVFIWGCGW